MKKNILLLGFILWFISKSIAQHSSKADSIFYLNPYREQKTGVVLQSAALAGFGLTTIFHLTKPPKENTHYMNLGIAYGSCAVMFFVGTVYHVQGINMLYKRNSMGYWTININPVNPSLAFTF